MAVPNLDAIVKLIVTDVNDIEATVKQALLVPADVYLTEFLTAGVDGLKVLVDDLMNLPKDAIWQQAEAFAKENYQALALLLKLAHIFKP